MTITLPDEMRDELEQKAKAHGHVTVAEYVAELVHSDEAPVPVPAPPAGARYAVTSPEDLKAKLLEGADASGDVMAGPDFWERRREAAEARYANRRPQ